MPEERGGWFRHEAPLWFMDTYWTAPFSMGDDDYELLVQQKGASRFDWSVFIKFPLSQRVVMASSRETLEKAKTAAMQAARTDHYERARFEKIAGTKLRR